MKKSIGIIALAFALIPLLEAQTQAKKSFYEEASAKALVKSPTLGDEVASLKKSAIADYASADYASAAQKISLAKILGYFSEEAKGVPESLKTYILTNPEFAKEIATTINPKDDKKRVFEILSEIWDGDSEKFKKFSSLALAIAVVFDVPPPETWPHHQVSESVLPRRLPEPFDAFKYWIQMREKGRLLLQPERLSTEELKFVVSSLSSESDKNWAQTSISVNLSNIPKLYNSMAYDYARLNRRAYNWQGADYSLETIKTNGGICTDQSYYTTEVAKARGVPAFICSGAGADGFHAWAAYMERPGKWNFNVGRYEASRFVTGRTIDPQTWSYASDHSLKAMGENFRSGPKYRQNEDLVMLAKEFFDAKEYAKAAEACNIANNLDSRNAEAWILYVAALEASGAPDAKIKQGYTDAIRSFSKYPDTDIVFRRALMKRLSDNSEDAEAAKLSSSIIIKTKGARPDIAMSFARTELENNIAKNEFEKYYTAYKRLLGMFKNDGAMAYNGITIPILNALLKAEQKEQAQETINITRSILKPQKNSTLEVNIASAEAIVKNAK